MCGLICSTTEYCLPSRTFFLDLWISSLSSFLSQAWPSPLWISLPRLDGREKSTPPLYPQLLSILKYRSFLIHEVDFCFFFKWRKSQCNLFHNCNIIFAEISACVVGDTHTLDFYFILPQKYFPYIFL